jgi:starvation-inducible DNA-binding protein
MMTEMDSRVGRGIEKDKQGLHQDLGAVLGRCYDLHVQGVEVHAHFIGTRFTGMQRQLEDIVQTAREASAAVAELLCGSGPDLARCLHTTQVAPTIPGLRPGERCTTAAVNIITHRISLLLNTIRCAREDAADRSTADLLSAIADSVGNQALLLAVESRKISSQDGSARSQR